MRRGLFIVALLLISSGEGFGQSYGLAFNSHESVMEKRTTFDLSPDDPLCFTRNVELTFDIRFLPNHNAYFGFVLRIVSVENQNIDLIFDEKSNLFKVIIKDLFSGISFGIDSTRLYKEWNHCNLAFNPTSRALQFGVNGKIAGNSRLPVNFKCLKFLWGANDFPGFDTKDVPPMEIKDIRIAEDGRMKYFWPLNETSGDIAYDKLRRQAGKIKNPVWVQSRHQQWELLAAFSIGSYAGVAFDPKQDRFFVTGSDSITVFTIKNEQNTLSQIPTGHLNLRLGHQTIYDTISDKLYDFYIDQEKVVAFDFATRQWSGDFEPGKITEFWHANKFISPIDSCLYIFGGYGQFKYKNNIWRYSFSTRKWELINSSGDYYAPRYLAGSGADPKGKFVYIIGGYGSETGDQTLAPGNFYDLLRYNVTEKSFKKIYTLSKKSTQFTFANSMVIGPGPGEYYGLIYPNVNSNSNLQLIKASFGDSNYQRLANSIPFNFSDVVSFTDLYYSPLSNKLVTVILHYSPIRDKQKMTEVKIYTLDFPPASVEVPVVSESETHSRFLFLWWLSGGVILIAVVFFFIRASNRPGRAAESAAVANAGAVPDKVPYTATYVQEVVEKNHRSAIYLFGPFQVFDKDGNDISQLFSPLLKELFLVLLTYTISNGRGISSNELNEILWRDKSEKDAMNNRSVNLVKLKTLLEKIGNFVIIKESGFWQIQVRDDDIYIDHKKYVALLQSADDPAKGYMLQLMHIIKRGPFLAQTDYNWLDDIKSGISNSGIHICLDYLDSPNIPKDPEFVVEIANCIFYFDQVNEDALIHKCKNLVLLKRHALASKTYDKFLKDYKDIYGADFEKSFQEVIS